MDLVRYQRNELYTAGLLSDEEYAALVSDSEKGQRVARLESYDRLRQREAALTARVAESEKSCSLLADGVMKYKSSTEQAEKSLAEAYEAIRLLHKYGKSDIPDDEWDKVYPAVRRALKAGAVGEEKEANK